MVSLQVLSLMALFLIYITNLQFVACSTFFNLVTVMNNNFPASKCHSLAIFPQPNGKHRKSMSNFLRNSMNLSLRSEDDDDYLYESGKFQHNHRVRLAMEYHRIMYGAHNPVQKKTLKTSVATYRLDPLDEIELILNRALFGDQRDSDVPKEINETESDMDLLAHYPSGQTMRAEMFAGKLGVHLPISQFMHREHCYLKITQDNMQTAVNAFSIFLYGTVDDVLRLPATSGVHTPLLKQDNVGKLKFVFLLSRHGKNLVDNCTKARTISMMKIAREKLVATWTVVKGEHRTDEITFQTLEMYRPLFKYINGREIAKLNLSDERILSYIGTHADLDRHQVGVVASKYIKMNENWNSVKYLNLMNNLLCGVPMLYMRTLGETTYLQLSHQTFYHIRSCDPLQRRFFLHIMTRTQVLGKSNSWSASDVARLGLLLTEVDAPELAAINPQAMSGITAQVMMEMAPQNLKYLSDSQLKYIAHKPLNILAKKMHLYEDEMLILNSGLRIIFRWSHVIALQLSYFTF